MVNHTKTKRCTKVSAELQRVASARAIVLIVFVAMALTGTSTAQTPMTPVLPQLILTGDLSGFIPFDNSYRINYQSSLAGLPVEASASVGFPVNAEIASSVEFRYRRRTTVLVSNVSLSTVEVTPGIRAYLEKDHPGDLRLFGTAGVILADMTASGSILATHDGSSPQSESVSKTYYNFGIEVGLGLEYAFSKESAMYAGFRVGVYFFDPIELGGLGDAAGVSLGIGYRHSFY